MTKLFAIAFFLQSLSMSILIAGDGNAQVKSIEDVKVILALDKVKIERVFSELERQTDFNFVFSKRELKDVPFVDIYSKGESLYETLMALATQTNLSFKQVNENIHVKSQSVQTSKVTIRVVPEVTVSGKVTDEKGEGLPGATVSVAGTTTGTVTDLDGNYTLTVPENAVLVFSFIGYEIQRISLDNRSVINVSMALDATSLEEVVVVGFGSQQKINLTGAISTVKFDDELMNRPITNASQALGGTASGVWVSQNSGKPGSDGAQIRVRGWGTLNNSNPLIIVDGVEGSFDQINPNDIESISVLKDAASSAIFGSKAANGVVLITTKMGKKDEKMQVNLNSYMGVQSLGRRFDVINNSAEQMELSNLALVNQGSSPVYPDELITAFRNGNDPYKYPNTDWFSELFNTAPIQEHNLSIRGGSTNTSSFMSFNYLNQDGTIPNTGSTRYGLRANVESNVNNWFKVSSRINYLRRDSNEPYADVTYGSLGRVFEMLTGATPYIAPFTRDGRFGSVQAINEQGNLLYDNRNPLIDAANGLTKTEENILNLNVAAEIKFSDKFFSRTTFASNGSWMLTDRFNTSVFGYTDSGQETITRNYNREGLEISRAQVSRMSNILFSTLNYNENFGGIHDVGAIAGIQLETNKFQNVFARRTMPPKEGLSQVDAGTSGIQGEGNMRGLRIFSYFGRINYALSGKYLFEANIRADASSRFKTGNRWGVFPGFSAGWRISDEAFMQRFNSISNLKTRVSWGQLGNQNIVDFWPYLTVINQNNNLSYNYNGNFAPGAAVTALIDENITWETTSTLDVGVELGLFDDKITLEAGYFAKTTDNIIVQLPIPLVLGGLTAPNENVGQMINNGFEFMINYNNLKLGRDDFGYNAGLNFTYIENMVTKFRGGNSPDQLFLIREGYSYRALYGFKAIGIYQTDEEALEHMHSNPLKPKAGNLKFEDLNNDGRITFEDRQELGNSIPKFTFGISQNLKYKGFDLNFLFQGILGVNMYTQNDFTNLRWENRVISTRWRDGWTPENPNTNIPSVKFDDVWDRSESSFWVQEVNFIKLKNLQLGYSFPVAFTSRLGLQKLYVYGNAQNLFVIVSKDYEGYDPERNTFNSGRDIYPTPRIISFGANLNF
ncbi:SusC/RagA family TonB-linked outer membrane protein [Aquiflexum lacus]|uniref:SusC/RagA family TonB-linked outer membrane protein n=1 Tax=Aquiflexum lacus TaxID=2483805 RepID=UPI001894C079|nr:SusC/RagA family TonB-linked outer membrane protein [Aquiflexum lacus]